MAANEDRRSLLQLIAQSGAAGRDQWRQQQESGRQVTADALARMLGGSMGRGPSTSMLHGARQQQAASASPIMAPRQAPRAPSYGKGEYGATQKGAYSGYKTSGDLKAAVKGAASMRMMEDQAVADEALQRLLGEFDTYDQGREQAMKGAGEATDFAMQEFDEYRAPTAFASPNPQALDIQATERRMLDNRAADPMSFPSARAKAKELRQHDEQALLRDQDQQFIRDYAINHEQQVAGEWDKYLGDLTASQEPTFAAIEALTGRPRGDYARDVAMQDFGIAPELAYGFFDPLADRTDYSNERDLQAWQQFGMPYSGYQSSLEDEQKAQTQQQMEALNSLIFQETGYGGQQLAQQVGMMPDQLVQVLSSPEYAMAYDSLTQAAQMGDPEAAWEAMDMASSDPRIARVLQRTLAQYVPEGYDPYGDPADSYDYLEG
jgi:hypothetical protein